MKGARFGRLTIKRVRPGTKDNLWEHSQVQYSDSFCSILSVRMNVAGMILHQKTQKRVLG